MGEEDSLAGQKTWERRRGACTGRAVQGKAVAETGDVTTRAYKGEETASRVGESSALAFCNLGSGRRVLLHVLRVVCVEGLVQLVINCHGSGLV